MTRPRKDQIDIRETPYYHITSRCVRRAFLCGVDSHTGKSYEHRRSWIESRIRLLSSLFGVDICAYAVMSNHIHLVVKLDPSQIDALTHHEVAQRWSCMFKGSLLFQSWLKGNNLDTVELSAVHDEIDTYRGRLQNLGWFMKCLNEPIARQANKEDGCTGHFWEARYKSYALLTEEALLSCAVYVDLNPIRAGIAATPESSEYTSIKERIEPRFDLRKAINEQTEIESLLKFDVPVKPLAPFDGAVAESVQSGILFSFVEYLELVDFTGRCACKNKRGVISADLPSILNRLNLDRTRWISNAVHFEKHCYSRFSKRKCVSLKLA